MDIRFAQIEDFLKPPIPCIKISILETKGSTPRNIDAFMLVNEKQIIGTIGGGNLEFLAIKAAKKMLATGEVEQELEISLGIKTAQCCGGWVKIKLQILDENHRTQLLQKTKIQEKNLPEIYLFGAGHVGKALANLLAFMPFKTFLIDTRKDIVFDSPITIKTIITPLPETIIKQAKANSAFVVFTHDHALDFLIMAEVLKRNHASYAGMIGSKTKCKKFANWLLKNGGNEKQLAKITCPIGQPHTNAQTNAQAGDKRPNIIAALTLSEIISNIGVD